MLQTIPKKEDEFEIIESYFKGLTAQDGVFLGIGDDAAILDISATPKHQLVVATDTLVENIHFPSSAVSYQIAQRALCVNLSDIAAMGAIPRWFTLSLSLPRKLANNSWLKGFSSGLAEVADEFKCSLIGGDTTSGALSISITMLGEVPPGSAITRGGANDGDFIYVSGALGDGAAALSVIQGNKINNKIDSERLLSRFYRPEPKIEFGLKLRDVASACIDISDGLVADLEHICRSSGVSANVNTSDVPIKDDVRSQWGGNCVKWALFGGDDYHLCFTVPEHLTEIVDSWSADGLSDLKKIGRMTRCNDGVPQVFLDGAAVVQQNKGFDHFGG